MYSVFFENYIKSTSL